MNNKNKLIGLSALFLSIFPLYGLATTVAQAVQTALNNLPDIQIDQANQQANAQTIRQAKAGYLPTINGNAGYGREHSVNPVAGLVDSSNSATLNRGEFGLNLTENVFDGFNTVYDVQRTRAETAAAAFQVVGTANDMALNVIEQYINVILQNKLVALSQQNVGAHQSIAGTISERQQAGVSGTSELSQANTRIALAKSNLITEQSNLDDANTEYERFVGTAPSNLTAPPMPGYPAIPRTETQALQIAVQNHPVLKSANADIAAAIAQHNESKFTKYPKVDLVLEADDDNNIDGVEGPQDNYLAMARLSYNFYAGGANLAKQRETAFDAVQAMDIRNRTILQTIEAVKLAWNAMVQEQKRVVVLNSYRIDAAQTFSSYSEEFKLNKRTLLDLLDTQNEVYQSNVSYQQARADELFARYRLLNAMGTLNSYLHTTVAGVGDYATQYVPPVVMPKNVVRVVQKPTSTYGRTPITGTSTTIIPTAPQVMSSNTAPKAQLASANQSSRYSIELVSTPNSADLNHFVAKNNLANNTVVKPVQINGKTNYELYYGNYSTYSAAKAAVASLPANLQSNQPLIRTIA